MAIFLLFCMFAGAYSQAGAYNQAVIIVFSCKSIDKDAIAVLFPK